VRDLIYKQKKIFLSRQQVETERHEDVLNEFWKDSKTSWWEAGEIRSQVLQ
jgi:hypothetical protein